MPAEHRDDHSALAAAAHVEGDDTSIFSIWLDEPILDAPINHQLLSTSSLDKHQAAIFNCLAQIDAAFPRRLEDHSSDNRQSRL